MVRDKYLYKIEVSLTGRRPACREILFFLFLKLGVKEEDIIEEREGRKDKIYFYLRTKKQVDVFREKFKKLALKDVTLKVSSLKNEDWRDKWKEHYRPFKITKTITVVPTWMREKRKWDADRTVFLDVGMAFGSGLHSTTRFTAELIESKAGRFANILDIGTGTGILAIIACKLGAEEIWCIDIDKEAIRSARANLKLNSCHADYLETTDLRKFGSRKKFDFVAANLQTDPLIDMRTRIVSHVKPGKYLAVSGIALCNYEEFREKFDGKDLKCLRIKRDKEWCAVLYRKLDDPKGQGSRVRGPGAK